MKLEKKHLLIIGAPRSGSTWLFNMLSEHPSIASLKYELTIYNRYFAPILKAYDYEKEFAHNTGNKIGLPLLADREELIGFFKKIVDELYNRFPESDREWIIDKHPFYSLEPEIIAAVLPNVFVIDLIRDGREVAVSWMNTRKKAGFGASDMNEAAKDWDRLTRSATLFEKTPGINYLKIYYHDLTTHPELVLKKIILFTGLSDHGFIEKTVREKANEFVSVPNESISEETRKKGKIWEEKMSISDRLIFNSIAGEQLKKLGFEKDDKWLGNPFILIFVKLKIKIRIFRIKLINLFSK